MRAAAEVFRDPVTGKDIQKVLVFRALSLGDLLCATPALRALRARLPGAEVTLLGLARAREFAAVYRPYIDHFIEFPGFPGWPERDVDLARWPGFLEDIQRQGFDLCLQMHGSGELSNSVISLFGARQNAGYYIPGRFCPDPGRFLEHEPVTHEIWRWLRLLEFLGAAPLGEDLDFFPSASDIDEIFGIAGSSELLARDFVCIHPGARDEERRWPVHHFARLADFFIDLGFGVALTGTSSEADIGREVISRMRGPDRAFDLIGRTGLRGLSALYLRSTMVVCNDTGVSHLAVALKVPSIVVFTRSELLGGPPLNRLRHRVVSRLDGPEVEDVAREALELLLERESEPFQDPHMARSRRLSLV